MLIGDSIMDDQMSACDGFAADGVTAVQKQGWAGDIGQYFNDDITLIHHGHSGNTMQMFIEGRKNLSGHTGLCSWDNVKSGVGENDYVIISMYGNDENRLTGARFDDVKSGGAYHTGTTDGSYWARKYAGADGTMYTDDDRQFSAAQLEGWYKEIIDECLAKGTKVLLVSRPPKTSDFDSSTGKFRRAASANVEGVINSVKAAYSSNQNVAFIDMSQHYADALNALIAEGETGASMLATKIAEGQTNAGKYITGSIFVDYSHLTARGAALYAEILAEKIGKLSNFGLASYLQPTEINFVLIGDSLVDDVDHTSSGNVQKEGWEGDIGQYFNDDVTIVPHGHGGATIQMVTEGRKTSTHYCGWENGDHIIKNQISAGDYVAISLGTNDYQRILGNRFDDNDGAVTVSNPEKSLYARMDPNYQFTAEQFKQMYSDIIDDILEKGAKVLILSPPPVSDSLNANKTAFDNSKSLVAIRTAITELKRQYESNSNVAYIDMADKYTAAINELVTAGENINSMIGTTSDGGKTYTSGSIFVDWCHFSAKGAALYAQVLAEEIGKLNNFGLASYLKTDKAKVVLVGGSMVDGVQNAQTGTADKAGWGAYIANYLDTSKIEVANHGHNGTSIQMFVEGGRPIGNPSHRCGWEYIKEAEALGAGDYVIITSSTNDETRLDGYGFDDMVKSNGVVTEIKTTPTQNYWLRKYYGADGVIDTVEEHNAGYSSIDDRQFTKEQFVEMYDSFIEDATGSLPRSSLLKCMIALLKMQQAEV